MATESATVSAATAPTVFLGIPHYGEVCAATAAAVLTCTQRKFPLVNFNPCSLLAHNFNRLWCTALNERASHGITRFAMLHADMAPDPYWLDVLLDELEQTGADILSAVVPIKDSRGLTSTGWQHPETHEIIRFTMKEVHRFPVTFDAAQAGVPDKWLMVNTGCWVCRLDRPWADEFPGFNIIDKVKQHADGRYIAHVLPEDWNFSGWAARRGLKVMATRKVILSHHGAFSFCNDTAWGTWSHDRGDGAMEEDAVAPLTPPTALDIEGWMTSPELEWLSEKATTAHTILEVGSWHGRSTLALAANCPGIVIAIDHFKGSPRDRGDLLLREAAANGEGAKARQAFHDNLAEHLASGKVRLIEDHSAGALYELAWKGTQADMVFLDGSHDYASVCADITAAKKVLRPGGLLCGHDADSPDVKRALEETLPGNWHSCAGRIWEATIGS